MTKTIPKSKKCKKVKQLSEEALQIAEERREAKGKGGRERYNQVKGEIQRKVRRDKKALNEQCKETEETVGWERLETSSRKLEIPREISWKNGHNKGQKWQGSNRSREIKKR